MGKRTWDLMARFPERGLVGFLAPVPMQIVEVSAFAGVMVWLGPLGILARGVCAGLAIGLPFLFLWLVDLGLRVGGRRAAEFPALGALFQTSFGLRVEGSLVWRLMTTWRDMFAFVTMISQGTAGVVAWDFTWDAWGLNLLSGFASAAALVLVPAAWRDVRGRVIG